MIVLMPQAIQHPLAELRAWLADSAARLAALRLFGPKARTEVAIDITTDAIAHSNGIAATAHSAETHDREALAIIDRVLADGRVTPAEIPALRRARALAACSAEKDHDISERATVRHTP